MTKNLPPDSAQLVLGLDGRAEIYKLTLLDSRFRESDGYGLGDVRAERA